MTDTPASTPFAVQIAQQKPVCVVEIQGDVDAATVGAVTDTFEEVIRDHTCHVVVDGRGVGFIDSTGISALLTAMRRLNRTRRRLALVHEGGALRRSLEVTGLIHTFEVHPHVQDAVAVLADAPRLGR